MYKRKTKDEYCIETNYGYGWEVECREETLKDAIERQNEYIQNARGLMDIRIKKRRIANK